MLYTRIPRSMVLFTDYLAHAHGTCLQVAFSLTIGNEASYKAMSYMCTTIYFYNYVDFVWGYSIIIITTTSVTMYR